MKISLAIAIVLGAILFAAATTLPQNTIKFYPVADYLSNRGELSDRFVKVVGNVVPGTIKYQATALDLRFALEDQKDKGKRLDVVYKGLKPDTLQDNIEVVAAGRMGSDGAFEAKELIVKCPSRYISTKDGKQVEEPASAPVGGR